MHICTFLYIYIHNFAPTDVGVFFFFGLKCVKFTTFCILNTNNGDLRILIQFVPLKRKASIGPKKSWAQTRIISCRILPFKLFENVRNILIIKIKNKNHWGEYDYWWSWRLALVARNPMFTLWNKSICSWFLRV